MGVWQNLEHSFYRGVGEYNFPIVKRVDEIPDVDSWIQFNYVKSTGKKRIKTGVNFYIVDQQFERVWTYPDRYAEELKHYAVLTGPDFSVYADFPKAVSVYNTYRNRWLTRYWQDKGLCVIPNVRWGYKESWDWCFDGLPENSIVAVSNVGMMNTEEGRKYFLDGYNEMLCRLQPKKVLFYAHKFDDYKGPVQYIRFSMDKTIYAE